VQRIGGVGGGDAAVSSLCGQLRPLTSRSDEAYLRQIVASSLLDRVAKKVDAAKARGYAKQNG
jgi:hypothetical protein